MNLSIFTVFLKNWNFISKIRRSKVTDYAAFSGRVDLFLEFVDNGIYLLIIIRAPVGPILAEDGEELLPHTLEWQ